jgi:hypothetical protein
MAITPPLFTSAKTDDTDASLTQASHWNRVVGLLDGLFTGADASNAIQPTSIFAPTGTSILHQGATTNPNLSGRKWILRYWDKTGSSASPTVYWTETVTPTANFGTRDNCVFQMGWNAAAGGGLIDGTYSGVRDAWEQYYEQSVPGTGYWERHVAAMPTDIATSGEVRMITMTGRADVTRDNMHPITTFQSEYWAFTYPSVAGAAYGDGFRIALDSTHFGASLTWNNGYGYLRRGAPSQGSSYPLFFQQNFSASRDIKTFWFGTADDDLHLVWSSDSGANVVHTSTGGLYSRLVIDGKNSSDVHGLLLFRDEQGSGTLESFIGHNASATYFGAPQAALSDYLEATLASSAHFTLTSALATFTGGLKHGSTTLLQTSVGLTNGAAAATATLTNAPTAGNPTKWVPINDNGTVRYVPAW